jgi:chromosome segregation ATPase
VNKKEAVALLNSWGWTQADANRALVDLDFTQKPGIDQILQVVAHFSGSELAERQRLQAAQKGQVTRKQKELLAKNQELEAKDKRIHELLDKVIGLDQESSAKELPKLQSQLRALQSERSAILASKYDLEVQVKELQDYISKLETQIQEFQTTILSLHVKIEGLERVNQDLERKIDKILAVNSGLMKDNRLLRNLVDQIKLKLVRDMNNLLRYDDAQIRKEIFKIIQQSSE